MLFERGRIKCNLGSGEKRKVYSLRVVRSSRDVVAVVCSSLLRCTVVDILGEGRKKIPLVAGDRLTSLLYVEWVGFFVIGHQLCN